MKAKRKLETVRTKTSLEKEKLLCVTNLLLFRRKCLEKVGEFFEEFFNQFFVKTVERSTDGEETKMTNTVPPNQRNHTTSKFQSWFQLGLCKSKMKLAEEEKFKVLKN